MPSSVRRHELPPWSPRVLLALFCLGTFFRGVLDYNRHLRDGAADWFAVLHGTADAPEQYRVGVVRAAALLSGLHLFGHAGPRLSESFAAFDLFGSLLALLLLYSLLERSLTQRATPAMARWFCAISFAALAFYALDWSSWYARVGTLPACGLTALFVWLWTPHPPPHLMAHSPSARHTGPAHLRLLTRSLAILAVTAALSTIRADLALFLAAGIGVASLIGWTGPLALPRPLALTVAALATLTAAAIQLYLMRVAYPQATYGITPVFMFLHDVYRLTRWVALLIFTAPTLWTLTHLLCEPARRRRVAPGPAAGLLLTAPAYLLLWIALGRLDEVRIFLPVAIALLPTTVLLALDCLSPPARSDPSRP